MKLLILADLNSIHTIRWITSLSKRNISIFIYGLSKPTEDNYSSLKNVSISYLGVNVDRNDGLIAKLGYLRATLSIKKIILSFKPDIIHAHYATSYGFLGAIQFFSPYIVSVWGSDIYCFPQKNSLKKLILKFIFYRANKILSTSKNMADEVSKYTKKSVIVTPFGIDMNLFYKDKDKDKDKDNIVIGTVKTLESIYGIEYLIRGFKIVYDKYPDLNLQLLIIGKGSLKENLVRLADNLKILHVTKFTGEIDHPCTAKYHNKLDIAVYPSLSESFGVSILESLACKTAVVATNVGGIPEIIIDGVTGLLVEPEKPEAIAKAIESFVFDLNQRLRLSLAGYNMVKQFYDWDTNVTQMIYIYEDIINAK